MLLLVVVAAIAIPACAQQDTRGTEAQQEKTQDSDTTTPEKDTTLPKEPVAGAVEVTGMIEKPEITSYMYGTHAVTDEVSGAR